jgi:hypothetical protein
MLKARRLQVEDPMRYINIPDPLGYSRPKGSPQPLTEISTSAINQKCFWGVVVVGMRD